MLRILLTVLVFLGTLNLSLAANHHGGKYLADFYDFEVEFLMRANGNIKILDDDGWVYIDAKRDSNVLKMYFDHSSDEDSHRLWFDLAFDTYSDAPIMVNFGGEHHDKKTNETYGEYVGMFSLFKWNKETKKYDKVELK